MKNYLSALLMLLISIIYAGCGGQNKYYKDDASVENSEHLVKISLHRETFSACEWYVLDDYAAGPTNSFIGIKVGSPSPIEGIITNSRYGLIWYYLNPDYEDHYGIVDDARFRWYEVRVDKSGEKHIEFRFMYPHPFMTVDTGHGESRTHLAIGDFNAKKELRADIPYDVLSDLLGSSTKKVVTVPVDIYEQGVPGSNKKGGDIYNIYMRREKTIGRVAYGEKITWLRKPGLSRIAIVNQCPLGAPSHYMVSDPIFFKEGYAYEFEYELVTGYKWGEFNMLSEPQKMQDSP
jgi:hypothetical protein